MLHRNHVKNNRLNNKIARLIYAIYSDYSISYLKPVLLAACSPPNSTSEKTKHMAPNIIYILVDDLGYGVKAIIKIRILILREGKNALVRQFYGLETLSIPYP